ncbi:MAG TPA: zinc metallopeptidase [Methylomirabilota bacterium]|nr:zinc metallopeptidase [Methylomirabilota bacterium]
MFFDPLYIGLVIVTLLISGAAQLYIRSTYGRWSKVANGARLSGAQIAEFLRERATFGDRPGRDAITAITVVPGNLSDHFDPRDRSLGLSQAVAEQPSIASMAIAAHEVGHAVQHAEGSALMKARSLLVPAASLGPNVGYLLIIAGLILQVTGLITIGIILFGVAVVFSLLTLPVEIDASRKALAMLDSTGLVTTPEERRGAQSMLTAAALTYVAAAITAVLTLVYYLTLSRRSN